VELLGYAMTFAGLLLGWIQIEFALLFLMVSILFGLLLTVSAILLEEFTLRKYARTGDFIRLVAGGLLEGFGYRQLTCWWRLKGTYDWLRGKRAWGAMERSGFANS
jgi:hypothetical protein